jgi:methionyl-tRNA synthetase
MLNEMLNQTIEIPYVGMMSVGTLLLILIGILIIKGLALWKSARKNEKGWFWVILIFNTLGILPLIYLIFYSKGRK